MARPIKHPHRSKPLLLCVDNSTMYGSVAIVSASGCISEHSLVSRITHSKRLLTAIAESMQKCELQWEDIDGLAIAIGPGSFTGLRIGLTTIKGICLATNLPLIGISSLAALASQFPYCTMPICPILDARKQEVYTGLYRTSTGKLQIDMEPTVLPIEKLTSTLKQKTLFIGDGVEVYRDIITAQLGENAIFGCPQLIFPRAAAIGALALSQFTAQNFMDPATASPLYIRQSDAEVNLKKAKAQATEK